MKKKVFFVFFVFCVTTFLVIFFRRKYNINDLVGIYVNTNFQYHPFLPEIPYNTDTLILNTDSTFYSNYWGKGTYVIKNNSVELFYHYEYGLGSYIANIGTDEIGHPKIILFKEMDHHYKKIY